MRFSSDPRADTVDKILRKLCARVMLPACAIPLEGFAIAPGLILPSAQAALLSREGAYDGVSDAAKSGRFPWKALPSHPDWLLADSAPVSGEASAGNAPSEDPVAELLEEAQALSEAGDYSAAVERYQQALEQVNHPAPNGHSPAVIDLDRKGEILYSLGYAYLALEAFEAAQPPLTEALQLYESLSGLAAPDSSGAAAPLGAGDYADILLDLYGALGVVNQELANFATALAYYRRALGVSIGTEELPGLRASDLAGSDLSGPQLAEIAANAQVRPEVQAMLLHNMGSVEIEIGQYEVAEATLGEAIRLSQQVGDLDLEASARANVGLLQEFRGDYPEAIATYQQVIALFEQTKDSRRQIRALNNLGMVYLKQADYGEARIRFDQGFALLERQDDPYERAVLLDSLGSWHQATGDLDAAWGAYLESWRLSRHTGDVIGEVEVLLSLGRLMEARDQKNLAIFFYKQAIAAIEPIRRDLQQLSQSVQQRYTLTIEDFYRNLADLLLQQNRVQEALKVLELLKLQEVKAYLHQAPEQATASEALPNTAAEAELLATLSRLGEPISWAQFLQLPAAGTVQVATAANLNLTLPSITALRSALASQPVKSVALYPLILKDRLVLFLISPEGEVQTFTRPVSQEKLHAQVGELQKALNNEALDPLPAARQLYDWLIRPLSAILAEQQAENIVYLPDGVLRYVPLAAFHDGQRWLVERYQSHNLTAASIDDLLAPPPAELSVLAGALTDQSPEYQVKVGGSTYRFAGLPGAQQEMDNLASAIANHQIFTDQRFTPERMLDSVDGYGILHLATHAKFLPGQPEASFILFGDGRTENLRDIQRWHLPNVNLVVLSACESASSLDGDGKEILGFGFQVRQTGAKAAIASLWSVDDIATAALMTQFYQALAAGKTKAAALRAAQLKLLGEPSFQHPRNWAAFVLIGNGL